MARIAGTITWEAGPYGGAARTVPAVHVQGRDCAGGRTHGVRFDGGSATGRLAASFRPDPAAILAAHAAALVEHIDR